jgi:DNA (cytosine-5)-methyltransferase 1
MKPRLLDLFSGAGGAAMGYYRVGFDVVGVDIAFQKHYPFEFHQADALEYLKEHGKEFDAIHASPPCQAYTVAQSLQNRVHPRLIEPIRDLLKSSGIPYIIENVPGSPICANLILCGSMFNLHYQNLMLYRHRLFETGNGFELLPFPPTTCNHSAPAISIFGHSVLGAAKQGRAKGYKHPNERKGMGIKVARLVMDCDWMTLGELSEAVPPAYTEFIGRQLIQSI